jgi:hypothetical protein
MNSINVPIEEIPEHVFKMIADSVLDSVVALVSLQVRNGNVSMKNGSGTLVVINDMKGILTAKHVVDGLKTISSTFKLFCKGIEKGSEHYWDGISTYPLHATDLEGDIPDLCFITSPALSNDWAFTKRSFHNISKHAPRMLKELVPLDEGEFWVIAGSPREKYDIDKFSEEKKLTMSIPIIAGFVGMNRSYIDGSFDYFEATTTDMVSNVPPTFQGISGGGLWHVSVNKDASLGFSVKSRNLWGVACRETEKVENKRSIIGHFRYSIYESLPKVVNEGNRQVP